MDDNEIFTMLRHECDWARKKKEMMVNQATTYLLWDASMVGFAIYFLDIKSIWRNAFLVCNKYFMITYSLVLLILIATVFCFIAGVIYFYVMQVRKMCNIEIEEYKEGYVSKKLIEDYEMILKDYDKTIEEYGKKLTNANICLFIGVVLLAIGIVLLKIII